MDIAAHEASDARHSEGLRKGALPFSETLAQSVANIAPTATPAVNLGLVFAASGQATWFTYLVATIGLLLIGICIAQFAKRSATPGSLYAYVSRSLGPTAGFFTGWGLILAYLTTGIAVIAGAAMYAGELTSAAGFSISPYLVYAICASAIFFIAFKDVSLSARVMLGIEAVAVTSIFILALIAMSKNGFASEQFSLKGMTSDGLRTGLIIGIFSFVGFESASAMGGEARNPLKTVPRAVLVSTAVSGAFFVIMSLVMVSAFGGASKKLDGDMSPLQTMAAIGGTPALGTFCSALAMVSLFACALACTSAVSRILMAMGRDGLLHTSVSSTHATNATPHIAAGVSALLMFIVPALCTASGLALGDIYGLNGTIATYGFLVAYILIAVGAMVYLAKLKESNVLVTIAAFIGIGFMSVAVLGSVSPYPAKPYGYLPIIFAVYMGIGAVCWMLSQRSASSVPANMVIEGATS